VQNALRRLIHLIPTAQVRAQVQATPQALVVISFQAQAPVQALARRTQAVRLRAILVV